jgi:hypothetical protein
MTGPTPGDTGRWGQIAAWDTLELAELARVLGVVSGFFAARPSARDHLARFAFPGLHPVAGARGAGFWTEELLGYLDQVAADLTALAGDGSAR